MHRIIANESCLMQTKLFPAKQRLNREMKHQQRRRKGKVFIILLHSYHSSYLCLNYRYHLCINFANDEI